MSVYHLTCVNYLYAALYAIEIQNISVIISSLVNWLITVAFTIQLLVHLEQSPRVRGWLLLAACFALPVASARVCHITIKDCADPIGATSVGCTRPLRSPLPRRYLK